MAEENLSMFDPDYKQALGADISDDDAINSVNFAHLVAKTDISDITEKLTELKIAPDDFFLLISSVFLAPVYKKKIFVLHPGDTKELYSFAREIMALVLHTLPRAFKEELTFCTLSCDEPLCSEATIYFVSGATREQNGGITRLCNRNISRDFIFDFSSGMHLHTSRLNDAAGSEFLNFVKNNISDFTLLSSFFTFLDEVSSHLAKNQKLSLSLYDDLTVLYLSDKTAEPQPNFSRILSFFDQVLTKDIQNSAFFTQYDKVLAKISEHLVGTQSPATPEMLKRIVSHYPRLCAQSKARVESFLEADLSRCMLVSNEELLFSHMDIIKANNELYSLLITGYFTSHANLLSTYFRYLLSRKRTVHTLFDFIDTLATDTPQLLDSENIRGLLFDRALVLYRTTGDQFVALLYIGDKSIALSQKHPQLGTWFESIYFSCLCDYYDTFSVMALPTNHIVNFPPRGVESLSAEAQLKNNIVLALKEIILMLDDTTMSFIHYDAFGFEKIKDNLCKDADVVERAEALLKEKLLNVIASYNGLPKRLGYTLSLYACQTHTGRLSYDFDKLISYLETELCADMLDFITWFVEGGLFISPIITNSRPVRAATGKSPDMNILVDFLTAVLSYYRKHGELLTDKYYVQKLRAALDRIKLAHPEMAECYKGFYSKLNGIIHKNYSALRLIFDYVEINKKLRRALISVFVSLACVAGIIIAIDMAKPDAGELSQNPPHDVITQELSLVNIKRSNWSCTLSRLDESLVPSSCAINADDTDIEVFDMSQDKEISVKLGKSGAVIDGVSLLYGVTDPNTTLMVSVIADGKEYPLSVSDYDTEGGSMIYLLDAPMTVTQIKLTRPENSPGNGLLNIKQINAFIIK